MEDILNLEFLSLKPEYIKIIMFVWNVFKCTFLLVFTVKLLRWGSAKFFTKILSKIDVNERKQQILTLKTIIVHAVEAVIFAVYLINMLFLFGIDVRPLLATAGVLGVAIGFGAKRFVEDMIMGIIVLIEGQIRVGDYVEIKDMSGIVEKITLNLVTVRSDKTGAVYFIRMGLIDSITNYTMHYSYAFFPLDVGYEQDIDHVFKTIRKSFEILKKNPEFNELILGDIEIFGLDEFRESSLCIKARIKTQPKGQWIIKRNFNKIIKEQFELENIEIPFNQIVVSQK